LLFFLPGHKADRFFDGNIAKKHPCLQPPQPVTAILDLTRSAVSLLWLRADGTVPTRASSSESAARGFSSTETLPSNQGVQAGRHLSLKMEFHHTSSRPSVDGHPSRSKSTVTKASCAHPIPFAWSTTGSNPNLLNNSFFKTGHFSVVIRWTDFHYNRTFLVYDISDILGPGFWTLYGHMDHSTDSSLLVALAPHIVYHSFSKEKLLWSSHHATTSFPTVKLASR
jgi:hypothetical protein